MVLNKQKCGILNLKEKIKQTTISTISMISLRFKNISILELYQMKNQIWKNILNIYKKKTINRTTKLIQILEKYTIETKLRIWEILIS